MADLTNIWLSSAGEIRRRDAVAFAPCALDATIGFSYDREQLADLAAELPVAGMLDLEAPPDQKMRLRVTAEEWRLELDEPTLFGSGRR